ncbi:MAG: amino acid transporter [Arenicella sp.]|jgi:amino acid transporter
MAQQKKFGTFAGVFTPSILTILGVIMYLRMGEVVGNSGLWGTILIILLAHAVSVTTGLSVSSIATDKKVGAGGVYYVLSRSLGLPIGGALGLTLFVATALSISLYMVGFAEIANQKMNFGVAVNELGEYSYDTNAIRITGSLGLLLLGIIALISTSIAIKSQFFILGAIILSLFAIFLGDTSLASTEVMPSDYVSPGFFPMFALFFPAVTGFTAGIAMSGDLKNPKKSIPYGTLLAIGAGLIVYVVLAFFLSGSFSNKELIENNNLLYQITVFGGWFVLAGVFGATLSSALGGILGGPRILQAMSVDKITPKYFAKGVGQGNEPRNALIVTLLIAEGGILIGDLNVIAEVVSMFYLTAYGFINLSFFLESWASSDFNPTFKVSKWIGLAGFIISFIIMSQLNLLAMVAAIVIIGGIYFYLSRKQVALGTGDIWQSVWSTIVKKGLKRMEATQDHKRNWKPNTLLFSTGTKNRTKMIEFSKAVSGQGGIITNFDLHENEEATVLFPKSKEIVKDEELEKYGIFGRKLEVQNSFKGIESIACTFGFSGIEPNTVLMSWPGETENPIWFTQMTQKLIDLDYNVLYLDYDERWGFRKQEKIDLWWRGVSNNSELMLLLAKFILSSPNWSQASVRILLVNETNVDFKVIENRIQHELDQFRVDAEIKIVNNEIDKKPIYDLMKVHSSEADLVFVGIPDIGEEEVETFVERTNNLVGTIGTTLLVKASSQFDETDLKIEHIDLISETEKLDQAELLALNECRDPVFNNIIQKFDLELNRIVHELTEHSVERIENYHHRIFSQVIEVMDSFLENITTQNDLTELHAKLNAVLSKVEQVLTDAVEHQLPIVSKEFDKDIKLYVTHKEDFINHLPTTLTLSLVNDGSGELKKVKRKVKFRNALQRIWFSEGMLESYDQFQEFGYQNIVLLHQSKNLLHNIVWDFLTVIRNADAIVDKTYELKKKLDEAIQELDDEALRLSANFYKRIRNKERENMNQLNEIILEKKYVQVLQEKYKATGPSTVKAIRKELLAFPEHWNRNITVYTTHLISDVQLIKFSARLQHFSDDAVSYTEKTYLSSLAKNIDGFKTKINLLEKAIADKNEKALINSDVILDEEIFLNSDLVVGNLVQSISEALDDISEEVQLMSAKSINGIRDNQGKNVETEKIALRDITEYLVKKEFEDPIHEQIQLFYEQLKRAIGKLINGTNLIQSGLDSYATSSETEALVKAIEHAKGEIKESESQISTAQEAFVTELRDRKEGLKKALDINQIIEQLETLTQYVKQHKRRSGISRSLQKVNQVIGSKVNQGLNYFVQKQQDISAIKYKSQYRSAVSEQGRIGDFMDAISPKTELPFYYQQMYSTTNYSDSANIESNKDELAKIRSAIERIDEGVAGAILILGASGSGKSFLTSHIANYELKGKTYQVHPPVNNTRKKEDLLKALQRATAIKGTAEEIMNATPAKTTFVFQNVERWWIKAKDGHLLLDELAKLIAEYGSQHYFVMNANIHAYQTMSEVSFIQDVIARSVILAPLTPAQIRESIWSRHLSGGLVAHISGVSEKHLSASKTTKFLNKLHGTSNGLIGVALNQWLAGIEKIEDHDIFINQPKAIEFPSIHKSELKNLIYQLFIHYSLTKKELIRLYGREHTNWIERNIGMLEASGLITINERDAYYVKGIAKPYVENWLTELGFLK